MLRFQPSLLRTVVAVIALTAGAAQAQFELPGFGPLGGDGGGTKAEFDAEFKAASDGQTGELSVTAILGTGWHLYSTTQEAGGPLRTSFVLSTL